MNGNYWCLWCFHKTFFYIFSMSESSWCSNCSLNDSPAPGTSELTLWTSQTVFMCSDFYLNHNSVNMFQSGFPRVLGCLMFLFWFNSALCYSNKDVHHSAAIKKVSEALVQHSSFLKQRGRLKRITNWPYGSDQSDEGPTCLMSGLM